MITLIFDGDCGFCTTSANFIVKESKPKVTAIPYQWADLENFGLTTLQTEKRVYLNVAGENFGGHKAVAKLLRLQPNIVLRAIGAVSLIPPLAGLHPCFIGSLPGIGTNYRAAPRPAP